MPRKLYSIILSLIFIVQLYGQYTNHILLVTFAKIFFFATLLLWLFVATKLKGRFHKRIFTGLIFALVNTIFFSLQAKNTWFFIYGIISILLCYVFYIRAYTLDHKSNPEYKNPYILWVIGGFATYCSGMFFYLQPSLGAMQFPVLMFAIIITFMAIMAFNRYGKVNVYSFQLIFVGSLFLILANSVWAITMFKQPIPQSEALNSGALLIAQYLIIYGTITRQLLITKTEI
ncbi:lysoplasmalogenase [Pedobacter mucosus]|uniref:lysoplasmalogenase n=1 Tax=Pedobacter mucosus TaxID=2895286 RepID=UPI001EE3B983|nr:lysoplasmalogenase [Pedobacter mucosus]UKT65695.1 lysoplasmalogenase [Pedobacter mucosus]